MFHRRAFGKRGNARAPVVFLSTCRSAPRIHPAMPIPREEYERQIAERIEAEEASQREERRYWIITLLVCLLWCTFGAFITGLGFALVLDRDTADVLIDSGQGIAAGGVLLTVSYAGYVRQKRGLE
jgi:hypothetical protein